MMTSLDVDHMLHKCVLVIYCMPPTRKYVIRDIFCFSLSSTGCHIIGNSLEINEKNTIHSSAGLQTQNDGWHRFIYFN